MATIAYLDIDQGSDFLARMELENDDGTPMNLAGFSVYSQFRKSYGSTIAYTFNASILNALNGVITLEYSGINSSATKPGRYLYDVEIIDGASGRKTRVIEGIVTVNAEITKIP
jgi:hypothetical protein